LYEGIGRTAIRERNRRIDREIVTDDLGVDRIIGDTASKRESISTYAVSRTRIVGECDPRNILAIKAVRECVF
jgi:hypothetical protein